MKSSILSITKPLISIKYNFINAYDFGEHKVVKYQK